MNPVGFVVDVCRMAGNIGFLSELRATKVRLDVPASPLFGDLMDAFSLQGISDAIAFSY